MTERHRPIVLVVSTNRRAAMDAISALGISGRDARIVSDDQQARGYRSFPFIVIDHGLSARGVDAVSVLRDAGGKMLGVLRDWRGPLANDDHLERLRSRLRELAAERDAG